MATMDSTTVGVTTALSFLTAARSSAAAGPSSSWLHVGTTGGTTALDAFMVWSGAAINLGTVGGGIAYAYLRSIENGARARLRLPLHIREAEPDRALLARIRQLQAAVDEIHVVLQERVNLE
ncbi:hypothetical protein PRIPAC_73305 [Pristionchus pacificus]|uniref:Uncharacterized protein n=1 Tax=Pristionchus pacificus TaxID=54126 RepID=A0A2A6C8Q8_PRIPA|nr:hypothetical protein PRIPAC_73305 [Pristionchus pacificus]|eukprot:PDM74497.1 hypothetical protein PRIPAC_41853 [Pristionchus pacificus]